MCKMHMGVSEAQNEPAATKRSREARCTFKVPVKAVGGVAIPTSRRLLVVTAPPVQKIAATMEARAMTATAATDTATCLAARLLRGAEPASMAP